MSGSKGFKLCCFDTSILIWAVQSRMDRPPNMDQRLVDRTNRLLNYLRAESATIIVPAPALAEYLTGIPKPRRAEHMSEVQRQFKIHPLDEMSSFVAAGIMDEKNAKRKKEGAPVDMTRNEVTVDCFIMGVAITARASILCTHNPSHFEGLCDQKSMQIRDLPEWRPEERQSDLFDTPK